MATSVRKDPATAHSGKPPKKTPARPPSSSFATPRPDAEIRAEIEKWIIDGVRGAIGTSRLDPTKINAALDDPRADLQLAEELDSAIERLWYANPTFAHKVHEAVVVQFLHAIERLHGLPPRAPEVAADPTYSPDNLYRVDELRQGQLTDDQYEFKKKVYKKAAQLGHENRGEFVWGVPEDQLSVIEGDTKAHSVVAGQAKLLLDAVRADWRAAKAAGDADAKKVKRIALTSTYRDADEQFRLWDTRFAGYWDDAVKSKDQKKKVAAGKMGSTEVRKLAQYIGVATAAPGYSQHQKGLAIDFTSPIPGEVENKKHPSENAAGVVIDWQARWRDTWLYKWLIRNSADFGFAPYRGEAWHWNYVGPDSKSSW